MISGASDSPFLGLDFRCKLSVRLGDPKTIEQISRHVPLNLKVRKSQTVIGADKHTWVLRASHVVLGASDSPFSVPFWGARVGVGLGDSKTIVQFSAVTPVNSKVIKSHSVTGTD